jgi:membrane associated rhomboid family serine protease
LDSTHRDDLFQRFLAALVKRPSGDADATLVGYQPPLALLEVLGESAALVLLDVAGASAEEVSRRAERIVAAHGSRLLLVVVGGGDDYRTALPSVGTRAQSARLLTTYHVDRAGRLERVVGPRSPAVEKAGGALTAAVPLAPDELSALIARGQKEREEAVNFAAQFQGRRPWVTMALVGVCVLLHLVRITVAKNADWGVNFGPLVRQGQVWRLLSSAFLHGSEVHLLMNMMGLWAFGGFLEPVMGWRRYLVLYGLSALVASLASALLSSRPSVGASGAIWGLMLGGVALMRAGRTIFPARMARQMRQRLLSVLVLNIAVSFIPGIDLYAHFGGGIGGFLLVASGLLAPRTVGGVGDEPFWVRAAAPIIALLMASSIVAALLLGRPWQQAPDYLGILVALPVAWYVHWSTKAPVPTVNVAVRSKVAMMPLTMKWPEL